MTRLVTEHARVWRAGASSDPRSRTIWPTVDQRTGGPAIPSDRIDLAELEQRTRATERLLSTLIAILSAREPRLLQELQAVFEEAEFAQDDAGRAAASTWARIARELKSTDRLMGSLRRDDQH